MSTALPQTRPAKMSEIDRGAFNAAFHELGLHWHWDGPTYDALAGTPCERTRVRRYLETEQAHLLRAYDAEFLSGVILDAKQRYQRAFANCSSRALTSVDWAESNRGQLGI